MSLQANKLRRTYNATVPPSLTAFTAHSAVLVADSSMRREGTVFVCESKPAYSVGPFAINPNKKTVTLQPGMYTVARPIVFGIIDETEITGVSTAPLPDADHVVANEDTAVKKIV
jgi:hypothetical protein